MYAKEGALTQPKRQFCHLTIPHCVPEGTVRNELMQRENFHWPSQPLSWPSASRLTGPPGRKPNGCPCGISTASRCPCYPAVPRPTASWGCTMLPTPPQRPHLKIQHLYWYLSAQVQCVPQTHRLARPPGQGAGPEPVSLGTHTHTKK